MTHPPPLQPDDISVRQAARHERMRMKMAEARKLTPEEEAALEALRGHPDSEIGLTDPETPEVRDWSGAVRGALSRPVRNR